MRKQTVKCALCGKELLEDSEQFYWHFKIHHINEELKYMGSNTNGRELTEYEIKSISNLLNGKRNVIWN